MMAPRANHSTASTSQPCGLWTRLPVESDPQQPDSRTVRELYLRSSGGRYLTSDPGMQNAHVAIMSVHGFPLAHGRRVVQSGRLLSSHIRLIGSLTAGIWSLHKQCAQLSYFIGECKAMFAVLQSFIIHYYYCCCYFSSPPAQSRRQEN